MKLSELKKISEPIKSLQVATLYYNRYNAYSYKNVPSNSRKYNGLDVFYVFSTSCDYIEYTAKESTLGIRVIPNEVPVTNAVELLYDNQYMKSPFSVSQYKNFRHNIVHRNEYLEKNPECDYFINLYIKPYTFLKTTGCCIYLSRLINIFEKDMREKYSGKILVKLSYRNISCHISGKKEEDKIYEYLLKNGWGMNKKNQEIYKILEL